MTASPPSRALAGVVAAIALAGLSLAWAFGSASSGVWPAVGLAWATALLMGSLIGLGVGRRGQGGATAVAVGFIVLSVGGGITAALFQGTPDAASTLWGGLPSGAALMIYVVGILPALVVPFVYAASFERSTLTPADLARLRQAGDRRDGPSERETSAS